MSTADDLNKIFEKMPEAFLPEKAAGMRAIIQLDLSGEGGGSWQLKIDDGKLATEQGAAASPDLTLGMEANDYISLSRGEVNPMTLFMGGKINLQGDMGLAMKFQEMFATG